MQASEFATFSIVKLTVFGMQFVKRINLQAAITEYLKQEGSVSPQAKFPQENNWFMTDDFK
jgi:hypothetical protein